MADYPASIFSPRTVANLPGEAYDPSKQYRLFAEDFLLPAAEIVAIETTLGENPQGSFDTVADRLDSFSSGNFVDNEIVGTGNGVLTDFVLAHSPVAGSVHVFLDGLRQLLGIDYTILGDTISFTSAVPDGVHVLADYRI